MQITINRLNKDVVDLTQDADENLARRLREDMRELNENWSHIISSTKVHSQHIQVSRISHLSINDHQSPSVDDIASRHR
jgi:chromosomal replication initiation ATPase DnaA